MRHSRLAILAGGLLVISACEQTPTPTNLDTDPLLSSAFHTGPGFRTSAPAQAELLVAGELIPLATAGEVMPGSGLKLAGVPDGTGSWGGDRFLQTYLNHEISGGSRVSQFTIDTERGTIFDHSYPIDGSEGYNRLCSASWQDAADGFAGGYFFTGEESSDGLQLAIDRHGNVTELPHLGYYAHEQQVSVPGFSGYTVVVNFDDDGTSGGDASTEDGNSELYMYVAANSSGVMSGNGQLYVFASDEQDNVGSLTSGQTIAGHWIAVPEAVARDRGPDATGRPPLNEWVDDPAHDAFDFTRLEDGFYDKVASRRGENPALYFFDTGDPTLGNATDGSWDKWGSVYRLEWGDAGHPAGTAYLTLVARSDGPSTGWASPDNGDINDNGVIMMQEDPAADPWTLDESRIWAFQRAADGSLVDPAGTLVAQTLGSDCLGDSGGRCWETSGIQDVSRWFGDNAWIFDVQSKDPLADCPECVSDGQLLIMRIGNTFTFRK